MQRILKKLGLYVPGIRQLLIERAQLYRQRDTLEKERDELKEVYSALRENLDAYEAELFVPIGHFYSPIPKKDQVAKYVESFYDNIPASVPAINMRENEQLKLLKEFKKYYADIQFPEKKSEGHRYYYSNPAYSYSDAVFLNCMLRHVKPKQVIEVGSGFSSCATLDTNEKFFENKIKTAFIEPYPELLLSLIREDDKKRISLIDKNLQEIELNTFSQLKKNDILFIDSTHVSKVNSDVNYIFSEILPALNSGVYVHFHDIFYPFEYPKAWLLENRCWTELYMLRAFLQYNDTFEIVVFNSYLQQKHKKTIESHMPLCLKNPGGSIWLRKL